MKYLILGAITEAGQRLPGPDLEAWMAEIGAWYEKYGRRRYPSLASDRIGSNNSTGLPDGSSARICLPPVPVTTSLRNRTPWLRSLVIRRT